MTQPTVSFRISQNAETLAETVHALSQRLVSMEQRLAAMEGDLRKHQSERDAAMEGDLEQLDQLDNVERLLRDCRELLETEVLSEQSQPATPSSEAMGTDPVAKETWRESSPTERFHPFALETDSEMEDGEMEGEDRSMAA